MFMFNRVQKVKDERIEVIRNKIYKEIVNIILAICLVSSIVKIYFYKMSNQDILLETIILIVIVSYSLIRSISFGVFAAEKEIHDRGHKTKWDKKIMQKSFVFVLVIALIRGVNSVIYNTNANTPDFLLFFMVTFVSIVLGIPIVYFILSIFFSITEKVSTKATT